MAVKVSDLPNSDDFNGQEQVLVVQDGVSKAGLLSSLTPYLSSQLVTYDKLDDLSIDWDNTHTTVQASSGGWEYTKTYVQDNSASWDADLNVVNEFQASSGGWEYTKTYVQDNSASWDADLNVVNEFQASSGGWEYTKTYVQDNSAAWDTDTIYDDTPVTALQSASAEWDSTYTTVLSNSAQWAVDTDTIYDDSLLQAISGNWDSTYTTVNTNSGSWDNTDLTLQDVTTNGATTTNSITVGSVFATGNNSATGASSLAVGGSGNTASGTASEVLGGDGSTVSGQGSTVVGGSNHQNSGNWSASVGGLNQTITSIRSGIFAGFGNTLSASDSVMLGCKNRASVASTTTHVENLHLFGGITIPTGASANYVLTSDANGVGTWQAAAGGPAGPSGTVLSGTTSNNTQTEIFVDGVASSRMTIATNTTWMFSAMVAARSATESAGYKIEGVIKNDGGTTSLVGTAVKTVFAEEDATWDVTVEADDTNDALVFKVTGDSADSVVWEVTVNKTEAS